MRNVVSLMAMSIGVALSTAALGAPSVDHPSRTPLERQTLPARDGFASMGAGTTGGANAGLVGSMTSRRERS